LSTGSVVLPFFFDFMSVATKTVLKVRWVSTVHMINEYSYPNRRLLTSLSHTLHSHFSTEP
jgi:hypothetical protein